MRLTRRSYLGAAAAAALHPLLAQRERLNVVFMLTDDHGQYHFTTIQPGPMQASMPRAISRAAPRKCGRELISQEWRAL